MQKLLREPLFHFLLIGAALFWLYRSLNSEVNTPDNKVILIDQSDIQRLSKAYQQNWGTPPDSAALKNLLKEEIKSEIFYREALRMQLDHNDEIIRRRLKQKYEFLVKDLADNQNPSEAALNQFYQDHQTSYESPRTVSFSHIYFSPDRRSQPLADAQNVFSKIRQTDLSETEQKRVGDNFHLQHYFAGRDYNDVRQLFGQEFTKALFNIEKTGWAAPIASGYGVHLVNLTAIKTRSYKPFAQVKERLVADWKLARQQEYNQQLYENLLQQYQIEFELEQGQDFLHNSLQE